MRFKINLNRQMTWLTLTVTDTLLLPAVLLNDPVEEVVHIKWALA
jgi:hypothetical protein